MELQELRQKISEVGFSTEVAAKLDEILAKAIANGVLGEADKTQMLELVDIDIESGKLEADAMENMATMLDSYANETESLAKAADAEEEKIADDADKEATELEAEIAQAQSGAQPVIPPVPLPETPVGQ